MYIVSISTDNFITRISGGLSFFSRPVHRSPFVMIVMLFALLLPAFFPSTIRAQDECYNGTCLGTNGLGYPAASDGTQSWSGSYVYFGGGSPLKYRVLSPNETAFGGKTMLLDCNSKIEDRRFNSTRTKGNIWAESDIKAYLNDTFLNNNFYELEQDAIASSTKTNPSSADGDGNSYLNWVSLSGEKIFLLDAKEMTNTTYGYSSSDGIDNARTKDKNTDTRRDWWLRSSHNTSYYAGHVSDSNTSASPGGFTRKYVDDDYTSLSPALNVKLSSVILSSKVGSGTNEYKLTVLKEILTVTPRNVRRNGKTISLNANMATGPDITNPKVYLIITDGQWSDSGWSEGAALKYYKELGSGSVQFELPDGYSSSWHTYLVEEEIKDGYLTSNAGRPAEVTIPPKLSQTITAADVEVTCGDPDNAPVSAVTDGDGMISYAVKAGSENYIDIDSSTGVLTIKAAPADGKAYVTVTASETDYYDEAAKDVTVTINKANGPAAPSGLKGVPPTSDGGSNGKITGVTTDMEYSADPGFTPKTVCSGTEITGLTAGLYYVRFSETATQMVGAAASVSVPGYDYYPTGDAALILPSELRDIQTSAFEGSNSFDEVLLPDGLKTIGARAFADCAGLKLVHVPDSVISIAADAFQDADNVIFFCQSENIGECASFARNNQIPYQIVP